MIIEDWDTQENIEGKKQVNNLSEREVEIFHDLSPETQTSLLILEDPTKDFNLRFAEGSKLPVGVLRIAAERYAGREAPCLPQLILKDKGL